MPFTRARHLTRLAVAVVLLTASAAAAETPEPDRATPPEPGKTSVTVTVIADPFTLSWWSVDGGGGTSTGGTLTVTGTVGQPDAGTAASHGQVADGGLWSGLRATIFADDLELGDLGQWSVVTP